MNRGDPDSNRLMARLIDKMDAILGAHGFAFRSETRFEEFSMQLAALVFQFYDDLDGGDSSYHPSDAPDSTGSSMSESRTLSSDCYSSDC